MEFLDYLRFLTQLGAQFDQLAEVEQEKIEAVKEANLAHLDDCIRREQAGGLVLRGLERQRADWLARLGLTDGPLRRLPEICPVEYRQEAARVVETVLGQYQTLKSVREASRTLLECQLHRIEGAMAERGFSPEPGSAGEMEPAGRTWTDFRV